MNKPGRPRLMPIVQSPPEDPFAGVPLCHRDALDFTAAGLYIGVSRSTIRTLVDNGAIPSLHIYGRHLIRRVELEAFTAAREAAEQERRSA